jgi:glutamyl/glutaminyl-tRNA synthetase
MAFEFDPARDLQEEEAQSVLAVDTAFTVLKQFREELVAIDSETLLDADSFKAAVKAVQKATGIKGKQLFHPVRVGITGKSSGPELAKLVPLLEKGSRMELPQRVIGVRQRLDLTLEFLSE